MNESPLSELNLVFIFVCGLASSKFVLEIQKTKLENVLGIGFQFFIGDSYVRGWVRSHQIYALLILSLILLAKRSTHSVVRSTNHVVFRFDCKFVCEHRRFATTKQRTA